MTEQFREFGAARLYLGDCRDILPTLAPADAVVTDPPYGTQVTEWDNPISDATVSLILDQCLGYAAFFYSNTRLATLLATIRDCDRDAWVAVWHKSNAMGFERRFAPQWVPIVIAYNGKLPFWGQDYHQCPVIPQDVAHPTPKPIGVTRWVVERASKPDDIVCDPFMGSGTTGIAALRAGRNFVGIEKNERYFEEACSRIARVTGDDAGPLFVEAA
jgi:DNA modification methylase